nr:ParA family protein [Vibrio splendidus]MCC4880879.1 ParA family protein [Vibrio splendidus]
MNSNISYVENNVEQVEEAVVKLGVLKRTKSLRKIPELDVVAPIETTCSKSALMKRIGVSETKLKKVMADMEAEGFEFSKNNSNHFQFDMFQSCEIARRCGYRALSYLIKEELKSPIVICVHNAKGGVGKSMTAQSEAVEFASDPVENLRVCLIDADPQGTQRVFLSKDASSSSSENFVTFADKFVDWHEHTAEERIENRQMYRDELINDVMLNTHIDSLKLLPSVPSDTNFEIYASNLLLNGGKRLALSCFQEMIIEPLRDDFDIFIFDMGPAQGMHMYNAYYASTDLLIPTTGKSLDFEAYKNYLKSIPLTISSMMPDDFKGFASIKTLLTRCSETDSVARANASFIASLTDTLQNRISESTAFSKSTEENLPIQFYSTDKGGTVNKAKRSVRRVHEEYLDLLKIRFVNDMED